MAGREFDISEEALQDARAWGLFGDTRLRLKRMARRAAPVTSPYGNRRFYDWFLRVSDGVITSITRVPDEA